MCHFQVLGAVILEATEACVFAQQKVKQAHDKFHSAPEPKWDHNFSPAWLSLH